MLDEAMNLTYDIETTPYNVGRIQFLMARATSEINILDLIISQLEEGVEKALMPPEPRNEVGIRIYSALECRNMQKSVLARVKALKNLMTDAQRKTGYIRRYTDLVNKHVFIVFSFNNREQSFAASQKHIFGQFQSYGLEKSLYG